MAGNAVAGEDLAHFRLILGAAVEGIRAENASPAPSPTVAAARLHPFLPRCEGQLGRGRPSPCHAAASWSEWEQAAK